MLSARSPLPIFAFVVAAITAAGVGFYAYVSLAPEAPTPHVSVIKAELPLFSMSAVPDHYTGTFVWDESNITQRVALDIHSTYEETAWNGREFIVATGRGAYLHGRDAHFDFEMRIDRETLDFTMTESNPNVNYGFVTDGAHKGHANPDGDISARWTSFTDGAQGTLSIHASEVSTRPAELSERAVNYRY